MKDEKELVQKISLLKGIEPRNSWVLFAKRSILSSVKAEVGQQSLVGQVGHLVSYLRYLEKPAFVFTALAFVVLGGIGYKVSQNSLPGDALYPVRSAIEKATTGSDALASLEVAQRRFLDLKRVVEENKVKNLSSATEEFTKSVAEASRGFRALVENEPSKALQVSRELVQLQKDKAQIEQVLGATIGGEQEAGELADATRILVENELLDLKTRTLSPEQEVLFQEAQESFKEGDYQAALEKVWAISNQSL